MTRPSGCIQGTKRAGKCAIFFCNFSPARLLKRNGIFLGKCDQLVKSSSTLRLYRMWVIIPRNYPIWNPFFYVECNTCTFVVISVGLFHLVLEVDGIGQRDTMSSRCLLSMHEDCFSYYKVFYNFQNNFHEIRKRDECDQKASFVYAQFSANYFSILWVDVYHCVKLMWRHIHREFPKGSALLISVSKDGEIRFLSIGKDNWRIGEESFRVVQHWRCRMLERATEQVDT